jgi:hypothetical protein
MSNPDPNLIPNAGIDVWSALINNTSSITKKTNYIFKRTMYTLVNKFCNGRLCNLHALQTSVCWFQNLNKSKTHKESF